MADVFKCIQQGISQFPGALAIPLQQMKGHSLCRLGADAWQAAKGPHHLA
jgi:hypothetical protein